MKTAQPTTKPAPTSGPAATNATGSKTKAAVGHLQGIAAQTAALTPEPISGGLTTRGGRWSADTFAPFAEMDGGDRKVGVAMEVLRFTPAAPVVTGKIGLVQSVLSTKTTKASGKPETTEKNYGDDPIRAARATDDGTNIDKAAGDGSPYFTGPRATWNKKQAEVLGGIHTKKNNAAYGSDPESPKLAALARLQKSKQDGVKNAPAMGSTPGSRKADGAVVDATLRDRVGTTAVPNEATHTVFETTAVCQEGPQSGVYLGSVTWGLDIAAAAQPVATLLPLAVKEQGAPTDGFMKAAEKWNAAPGYKHAMYYDQAKASGQPYDPKSPRMNEELDFREQRGVPKADLLDGKPDPAKWTSATVDIKNEALPVLARALYDRFLPQVTAAKDAAALATVKAAFDAQATAEALPPAVAATTWKNLSFGR